MVGESVFFTFNCVVLDVRPVSISRRPLFGPNGQLYTATRPLLQLNQTFRVAVVATAPAGLTVTWTLDPDENTQFHGAPIPTTFVVTAVDLARGITPI